MASQKLYDWKWTEPNKTPGPALLAAQTRGAKILVLAPAEAQRTNTPRDHFLDEFTQYCKAYGLMNEPLWLGIGRYFESLPHGHYWRGKTIGGRGIDYLNAKFGALSLDGKTVLAWDEPPADPAIGANGEKFPNPTVLQALLVV